MVLAYCLTGTVISGGGGKCIYRKGLTYTKDFCDGLKVDNTIDLNPEWRNRHNRFDEVIKPI